MKSEGTLDSAGPLTIMAFVALVLAVATWVMLDSQGSWGEREPASAAAHAPPPDAAH